MSISNGFWSYVHLDDDAEGGRIAGLARDVKRQYELLTGESLTLFLDRDALKWGDDWRAEIGASLSHVAFFVPVLTPRYFMSVECRRELQFFARRATDLGVKELVLPILYADFSGSTAADPGDDLLELARKFQWEDWRELRFEEPSSAPYRRAVSRLADRLVQANRQAEEAVPPASVTPQRVDLASVADDEPGFLDTLSDAERSLESISDVLAKLTASIGTVGTLASETTAELSRAGQNKAGFAVRLAISQRLATRLAAPVEDIHLLSDDYSSHLYNVDMGFRILIARGSEEALANADTKRPVCEFFSSVRYLYDRASESMVALQGLSDSTRASESVARSFRPPLRLLRAALTRLIESTQLMKDWIRLIDESGVECDPPVGSE